MKNKNDIKAILVFAAVMLAFIALTVYMFVTEPAATQKFIDLYPLTKICKVLTMIVTIILIIRVVLPAPDDSHEKEKKPSRTALTLCACLTFALFVFLASFQNYQERAMKKYNELPEEQQKEITEQYERIKNRPFLF